MDPLVVKKTLQREEEDEKRERERREGRERCGFQNEGRQLRGREKQGILVIDSSNTWTNKIYCGFNFLQNRKIDK